MATRTGKVIIAKNIKLDKDYRNVLDYTESEMLQLVNENKVDEGSNFSFIKVGENTIDTNFSYEDALKCNYMALQNPNYSNKWFFCFIDSCELLSNNNTRIHYTIDIHSTWFDYWTPKTCFVVREHVTNDAIGLHTIPENVETGEFVCNDLVHDTFLDDYIYVLCATERYNATEETPLQVTNFGGVTGSGVAYILETTSEVLSVVRAYNSAGKKDAITNVYIVPKNIVEYDPQTPYPGQSSPKGHTYNVSKQTTLNGYTPKNNKLLSFPFNYLVMSNNNGVSNVLRYEDFSTNVCGFEILGIPVPGASIKCIPQNYKNCTLNHDEGITCGKYSTCSWGGDPATAWLVQNEVNLGIGIATDTMQIVGGMGMLATGAGSLAGASSILSGSIGIASTIGSVYSHSLIPKTSQGNTNIGDLNTANKNNGFYFYKMSVKQEYAIMIDDYFTRLGYKVNKLKIPNMTGRTYWNYVQIGTEEDIGFSTNQIRSVPMSDMVDINNIYRRGTTIWHNHVHVGNYALDNTL